MELILTDTWILGLWLQISCAHVPQIYTSPINLWSWCQCFLLNLHGSQSERWYESQKKSERLYVAHEKLITLYDKVIKEYHGMKYSFVPNIMLTFIFKSILVSAIKCIEIFFIILPLLLNISLYRDSTMHLIRMYIDAFLKCRFIYFTSYVVHSGI